MATTTPNPALISEHELAEIRTLIERRSGVQFDASRELFFTSRLIEYARVNDIANGSELLRRISRSNVEFDALLERLLTQETSFYRYPGMFEFLGRRVLPEAHKNKFWANPRKLRIWSAGCATGEEPYSVAITVAESLQFSDAWDIEILATDISRSALAVAERGQYSGRVLANLAPAQLTTHFTRQGDMYEVRPRLRSMVKFAPMNLANPVYMGRFDCIFCMNVLIYFTAERRAAVIQRFHEALEPGGYLFLGHAETAANTPVKFSTIVGTDCRIYQKPLESPIMKSAAASDGSEKEKA